MAQALPAARSDGATSVRTTANGPTWRNLGPNATRRSNLGVNATGRCERDRHLILILSLALAPSQPDEPTRAMPPPQRR